MHKSGEATGEHAASIEYLKAESAYLKTNMSIAVFDAKLGSAVAPLNTRVASVEEKLKSMAAQAAASAQKKETCAYVLLGQMLPASIAQKGGACSTDDRRLRGACSRRAVLLVHCCPWLPLDAYLATF